MIRRATDTAAWAQRAHPLEVVLQSGRALDPLDAPDRTVEIVGELRTAGATGLSLRLVHHSVSHYIEQLTAATQLIGALT